MNDNIMSASARHERRLMQLGVLLLLLGLLTGFAVPLLENPRMGLASHMEGVLNGILLVALGLVWARLRLSARAEQLAYGLALYGTFANWSATLLAAAWGAGAAMPIAAVGHQGSAIQEAVIGGLLLSLSFAMVALCALLLRGLRDSAADHGPARGIDPARSRPV